MKVIFIFSFLFVSFATFNKMVYSQDMGKESETPLMMSFTQLNWINLSEVKGMQYAVLSGDPKTGEYTQMRKVPAGTNNALHFHSNELKNIIISGTWYTGVDSASAKDFGPGSIIIMPANWEHVSGCRPGSDCVFYQEGKGKFDFHPVTESNSDLQQDTHLK
jgi:hypothetical protein